MTVFGLYGQPAQLEMYCGTSMWLDSFNEKPMAGLFALNKPTGSHFDAFKSDMDQDIKKVGTFCIFVVGNKFVCNRTTP